MTRRERNASDDLSIGRLALYSMGAATAVLLATTVVILVWQPAPVPGLIVGLLGVVAAIVAMGYVSTRMTRKAYGVDRGDPRPGSGN